MRWTRIMKRMGVAAIAAVMGLSSPVTMITSHAAYENVMGSEYDNTYVIIRKDPTGKVGKNISVPVTIKAPDYMEDVWVGFSDEIEGFYEMPEDGGKEAGLQNRFPFEINESTFKPKKLGNLNEGSTKTVTLSARVRRDMAEGYYCIPIAVYIGGPENTAEVDYINVWIGGAGSGTGTDDEEESTEDVAFVLGEGQSTPYGTYPNVMNFGINMRNKSLMPAYDVTVSMVLSRSDDEFPFKINDGNYDRHFDVIESGQTVQLPYSMAIRENSYTGYYPLKFKITYRESMDGDQKVAEGPGAVIHSGSTGGSQNQSTDTTVQSKEYEFYVHITSKEKEDSLGDFNENDRTKARIIVEGFQTIPEKIMAGEEFEMVLRMKNASTQVAASNILFTLEPEKVDNTSVFSTESGSSSIVVNSLGAGESTELRMKFLAKAGIDQRSYSLTIKEKYDSPEFKNAEESVVVDVPIYQKARFSTSTFEVMPESIEVGGETNIMFGVNNTGRIQLYNVNARFEADSIKTTEAYVGNIKPGETGNVDIMVTGEAPTADDGKIKVIISYEDENGEVTETEKELNLFVTEPMMMDEGMMGDMSGMEGMEGMEADAPAGIAGWMADPVKKKILIAGGVVLVAAAAAGTVLFVKHRKKKKAQKEEEEGIDDEIS
ncbi:MAG: CARDB domain-containing protein [Lachnospiraceae bacterium]|nr:CARDB domain-containing protein [Lachnospiraceae bacterium]